MHDNRLKQELYELDKGVFDAMRYADADINESLRLIDAIFAGMDCPALRIAVKASAISRFQAANMPRSQGIMS